MVICIAGSWAYRSLSLVAVVGLHPGWSSWLSLGILHRQRRLRPGNIAQFYYSIKVGVVSEEEDGITPLKNKRNAFCVSYARLIK